jgi:hypothetical protein
LRFSENIPYNEDMLASVTNTNVDIVRSAIRIFTELEMMELMDDGTFFMQEVHKMIGSETYWAGKKREEREDKKALLGEIGHCPTTSNECPTCPSKRKDTREKRDIIPPIAPQGGDDDRFNRFWAAYPKRVGKTAARKAFAKIKPDDEMMNVILEAVELQGKSDQWKRDGGQYIPNPATWLNQGRWEDELTIPNQGEQLPQRNFLN